MSVPVSTEVLEKLRLNLGFDESEWHDRLRLTRFQYVDALTSPKVKLEEQVVLDLAEELEILPESLVTGNLDFVVLAKRHSGHAVYMPEVYSTGAFSRIRTSVHLLNCVESHCGWKTRYEILKRFQMNESIIADPDMNISIRFLADLCDHLQSQGVGLRSLFEMGKSSVISNYSSPLGQLLRTYRDPKKTYEFFFSDFVNRYYDENFEYRLTQLDETSCTIEAWCREKVCDAIGSSIVGSAGTCSSRGGIIASITGYLNLPYATVRDTACIHRGDTHCRYEVDFGSARSSYLSNTQFAS